MLVTIGTRGSQLAMWQAHYAQQQLHECYPDMKFIIKEIKTKGDLDQHTPLSQMGGSGLFTKQLEKALSSGEVDIAVHSLKDMPSQLAPEFCLAAIMERENPSDVFVSEKYCLADMQSNLLVGTGSLRRGSQLQHAFPQIRIKNLRGNVNTRLQKLYANDYDAIILAYAGLKRLGLESTITEMIPIDICIPATAQGAIGIEIMEQRKDLRQLVQAIDHPTTRICVQAERTFLRIVEGGCKVPVGCHAYLQDRKMTIAGFIGDIHGKRVVRRSITSAPSPISGKNLALAMLEMGGAEILKQFSSTF